MAKTTVFENRSYRAMRALVLSILDKIEWRHHGIGVLQGYVREHSEPEVRIHIWSRRLLKPGMDVSGDIHDHRFNMVSHVLCGSVEHEEITHKPDRNGDHTTMALTHARAAADTDYHGPTTPLGGVFSVVRDRFRITEGWSYFFPSEIFHRSPLERFGDDVSVTCVEKHQQKDAPARLLYPIGQEPVMAFGHKPDQVVVGSVLSIAKDLLKR